MEPQLLRPPAVAGSWYPAEPSRLSQEIARLLEPLPLRPADAVRALIAPHAGLMYSGPVAAHAYRAAQGGDYEAVVLVGPSHYVAFEGVSIYPRGGFDTPLGAIPIAADLADALMAASHEIHALPAAHRREHSLEMQLPFLRTVLPDVPIVPLVMGHQHRDTIVELGRALSVALAGRRVLLIASTDLSHFFDAREAARLDGQVIHHVSRFDPMGLLTELESYPEGERGRCVACGGGPAVSVMMAARALGSDSARILHYADSGDISGDKSAVVGYLAAAMGNFKQQDHAD